MNEACETIDWDLGRVATFTVSSHAIAWQSGTSVDVTVSITDVAGEQLASISERRTMNDSRCGCAGFSYRLKGTDLTRSA